LTVTREEDHYFVNRAERDTDGLLSVDTWSRLSPLLSHRRGWIAALGAGSVLSGFTEAGILAVLAQVAAALVDGSSRVHVELGPMNVSTT